MLNIPSIPDYEYKERVQKVQAAMKKEGYDLILCGKQTTDGDTAQVGPMLSQMLKTSLITNALKIEVKEDKVFADTRVGEEYAELPALVTVERGYVLRFPSIFLSITSDGTVLIIISNLSAIL